MRSAIVLAGALLVPALALPRVHAASSTPSLRGPRISTVTPTGSGSRRSGYVLGDVIEQRAVLTAPRGYTLDRASVPALHRVNIWLALLRTAIDDRGGSPPQYEIVLQYQLINAPLKVRSIELPDVHVRFNRSSGGDPGNASTAAEVERLIAAQRITIAPILPADVPLSTKLLRPDRPAHPLSTLPERLAIGLGTGLASMILSGYLAAPILRRRNGPFARAYGRIRRAAARAKYPRAEATGTELEALRALHRAFDQTAGWSVFHDCLDEFLAQQRHFEDLRDGVVRFMQISQRAFFECRTEPCSTPGADREGDADRERSDLRWLIEFARECRTRERQAA